MVKLVELQNEGDLALMRSLLDSEGIVYLVLNERTNPLSEAMSFVRPTIMVHEADLEKATALIKTGE
jgi:hypothetical protein